MFIVGVDGLEPPKDRSQPGYSRLQLPLCETPIYAYSARRKLQALRLAKNYQFYSKNFLEAVSGVEPEWDFIFLVYSLRLSFLYVCSISSNRYNNKKPDPFETGCRSFIFFFISIYTKRFRSSPWALDLNSFHYIYNIAS